MEKSAQWMTLQELRDELDRTRPAWNELADLGRVSNVERRSGAMLLQ